jgi:tetratricopeptide (TPR) repeat protein
LAGVHGPAGLGELGLLEGDLAELVTLERPEADWFLALARLREDRQRLDEAEAALLAGREALPDAAPVHRELARFYRRHERFDAFFAALERRLEGDPDDRDALHALVEGCFYRAFRDYSVGADRRRAFAGRGIVAAERLLRLEPDHAEGRRYLELLSGLRARAEAGRDPHP